jgi:putative acetyltransferase
MIRPEQEKDFVEIHAVHEAAFPTPAEANLVDNIRAAGVSIISLVAEQGHEITGHILYSPMTLPLPSPIKAMGLGPLAVLPERQGQGIGSGLVMAGLDALRALGVGAVFVIGHPSYYPKFGFVRASVFGITCEYDAPDEAFMARELVPGALDGISGVVKYHPYFNDV